MKGWGLLAIGLVATALPKAYTDTLAQRVWQRYAHARTAQVHAVSRFEDLSLEAKPSVFENTDPAQWKRMEQEVKRLVGQEIRTHIAVQRPNRFYLEQKSAFGWFRSVCDGKVWRLQRQDGDTLQTSAPSSTQQMTEARYRSFLGLDEGASIDVLHLLMVGAPSLRDRLLHAKEQAGERPNLKLLTWSEPILYQGMKGQGTITCIVDMQTARIQRVEYRFTIEYGAEVWLKVAIGQRWDNSQLAKLPPPSLFRLEQVRRGASKR
ncbi:MAG: hypothetical protein ACUVTY_13505 [Armatimonadota bacterium]